MYVFFLKNCRVFCKLFMVHIFFKGMQFSYMYVKEIENITLLL